MALLHLEQVERLSPRRGGDDAVAVRLQVVGEEVARRLVVLDHHDRVAVRQSLASIWHPATALVPIDWTFGCLSRGATAFRPLGARLPIDSSRSRYDGSPKARH